MGLETDYVRYSLEVILSILAASSAYFFSFGSPETALVFITVPLLYGYTAYISRDSFQRSSLLSLLVLPFVFLGTFFAAVAVLVGVGNVLVSFFSSGESFRSFYGSVSLPLLFTGFIIAGLFFAVAVSSPGFAGEVENSTAEFVGDRTGEVIEQSGLVEMQRDAQAQMMSSVGSSTVLLTEAYVMNQTSDQLGPEDQRVLLNSFAGAREDVPEKLAERVENSTASENKGVMDVSSQSQQLVKNLFRKEFFLLAIPLIGFGIYGLHPILGLLTGIFGVFFRKIDSRNRG